MSEAVSFAEYSCWNGEDFRYSRKPVVFNLFTTGALLGVQVRVELVADYGIWYHRDDEEVIRMLTDAAPQVDWGLLVYHRCWDHSGIDICHPDEDKLVARLEVRCSRTDVDLVEDVGANVVRMSEWRVRRLNEVDECPGVLLLTEIAPPEDS